MLDSSLEPALVGGEGEIVQHADELVVGLHERLVCGAVVGVQRLCGFEGRFEFFFHLRDKVLRIVLLRFKRRLDGVAQEHPPDAEARYGHGERNCFGGVRPLRNRQHQSDVGVVHGRGDGAVERDDRGIGGRRDGDREALGNRRQGERLVALCGGGEFGDFGRHIRSSLFGRGFFVAIDHQVIELGFGAVGAETE